MLYTFACVQCGDPHDVELEPGETAADYADSLCLECEIENDPDFVDDDGDDLDDDDDEDDFEY